MHILDCPAEKQAENIRATYNLIYSHTLPENIRFLEYSECGCNMGHCSTITDVSPVPPDKVKTVGDLFALFGELQTSGTGISFYEYPDSVLLTIREVTNIPKIVGCGTDKKYITLTLDPKCQYFAFSYGR